MPKLLDKKWLISVSEDAESEKLVKKLCEEQIKLHNDNIFNTSKETLEFHLCGVRFASERCGAVCTLEVFEEIFKCSNHFKKVQEFFSGNGWVLDVGANHGFFTLFLKKHFPEVGVLAIEPNPHVFDLLIKNISLNGYLDVKCLNLAAGDSSKIIHLPVSRYVHSLSGVLLTEKPRSWLDSKYFGSITVRQKDVDSIIQEASIPFPEWIKIDVEGMEDRVLDGAALALQEAQILGIERHRITDRKLIINRINKLNFSLCHESDPALSKYYDDLLFVRDSKLVKAN